MGDTGPGEAGSQATAGLAFDSTQALKFPAPRSFSGKEDEFEQFSFKLKGYLSLSNPRFRQLMNEARDRTTPIQETDLEGEDRRMAVQLQNALIACAKESQARLSSERKIRTMGSRHGGSCVPGSHLRRGLEQQVE